MSRTLFSLAGFQVITIGRFWVIAEGMRMQIAFLFPKLSPAEQKILIEQKLKQLDQAQSQPNK